MASSSNGNAIDKATLGALPNEILTKICQNLEPQFISRLHGMWHPYNYDALHALCLVKRRFRDVAQQHLYTTVQIMDTNVVHLLRTFLSREDLAGRVKAAHIKIAANTWDGYNCSDPADTLAVHEAFVRSGINLVHWMVACSESGGSPEMALTQLLIGSMPNLQHLETLHPFVPALTSSVQGGQKFMFSEKLTSLSIRARSTVYSDVTDPTFLESILVASKVRRLNIENLHESAANLGLREKYSSVRELNLFDPHLRLDHGLLLQHFPGLQSLTLTGTAASYRLMAYQWDPVSQWCEIFKSTSTLINLRRTLGDLSILSKLETFVVDRFNLASSRGVRATDAGTEYRFAQAPGQWQHADLPAFEHPCERVLWKLPDSLQTLCILRGDRSLIQELERLPDVVDEGHLTQLKTLQLAPWRVLNGITSTFDELHASLVVVGIKVEAVPWAWDGTIEQFRDWTIQWGCNL